MLYKKISFFLLTLILSLGSVLPANAQAAEINLNYLISDTEMADYNSMSQTDIMNFLRSRGSYLGNYFMDTGEAQLISATEIIYRAAQTHKINPKFLLALLEKEQSLVSQQSPSQRALDFATGYGCFTGQTCQDRWKGFYKQVNSAAMQFRYYIDNIGEYNIQPNKPLTICNDADNRCEVVTPSNVSTAALYIYTPHIHGNELFRRIWDKFFAKSIYPEGSLLQVEDTTEYWLIKNGERHAFASNAAFISRYSKDSVLTVQLSDLQGFPMGQPIQFAANTLISDPTGNIYLVTANDKRLIISQEVFKTLGFNPEEVQSATVEQLASIGNGPDITMASVYPTGALIQNKANGGVYYVENGTKYPIWAKEIMTKNYPKLKIFITSAAELDKYPSGTPTLFKDGVLFKTKDQPDVYVVSNGQRRKIMDEKTFTGLGYRWNNIVVTNDKVLQLHPEGSPLGL